MSFRSKIILIITMITGIVAIATSVIYYNSTSITIEENYRNSIKQHVNTQAEVFDEMLKEMYYATVNVSQSEELIELLKGQIDGQDNLFDISIFLHSYHVTNENIDSIYVYIPDENKIVKSQEYKAVIDVEDVEEYSWIADVSVQTTSFSPSYILDRIGSVKKRVFLYSKPIYDPSSGIYLGEVTLNMDERVVFYTCLDDIHRFYNSTAEIVKADGTIASSEQLSRLGTIYNEDGSMNNVNSMTTFLPFSDYRIITTIDVEALTKDMKSVRNRIISTALLAMFVSVIMAVLLTNRMYERVRNLKNAMQQLSHGEMGARAKTKGKDEISELSVGFNEMVIRIENLIDEVVTEKILKKEAELEALQYQITPHFMYNTLNSIKCAAYLKEADEIGDLLEAFIELLQSSISKKGAFITLREELLLVENYVLLQKFRFQDNFFIEYILENDIENLYVPRLILQPLVENAIFYGLDTKTEKNAITINALKEDDMLKLVIEDNGKGMTEYEMSTIFQRKKSKKEKFNHIGIANIKERINLYYGEHGSMTYDSIPGEGVRVTIIIPAEKQVRK